MKTDIHFLGLPAAPAANRARVHSSPSAAGALFSWKIRFRTGRLAVILFACTLAISAPPVRAGGFTPAFRVAESYRNGADVALFEAAWYARAPRWTRAASLEVGAGLVRDAEHHHGLAFIGPVWRWERAWFAEASIGPILLTGSTIRGRDLGGRFHFRPAIEFGKGFGAHRTLRLALRISHISNGALRDANPVLDFVGLGFQSDFPATSESG